MRVAIVHDWLTGMRGGEKCLEVFCELFPDADIFTLVHEPGSVSPTIEKHRIVTSWLQGIPGATKRYRALLPLFPSAVESMDFSDYDLILSSSHCVALGAVTRSDQLHLCYCYSPMRYMHDLYDVYFPVERIGPVKRSLIDLIAPALRSWDLGAAQRPNEFIAISHFIEDRIERIYHRDSVVVYPPVDMPRFRPAADPADVEDFYLLAGAFAPYKRADIAIEAFNRLGKALIVIGTGQDMEYCKSIARINVDFLGWQDDKTLAYYYSRCKALIFPGVEDFGITPLEAQASGRPVIAYGEGGALETVVAPEAGAPGGPTGLFFHEQTPEALMQAVLRFEATQEDFTPAACLANAAKFDRPVFKSRIQSYIDGALARFGA